MKREPTIKFPHTDNYCIVCHISLNLDGAWLLMHKIDGEELHFKKVFIPFRCMFMLTNAICSGGSLSPFGLFHFHVATKTKLHIVRKALSNGQKNGCLVFANRF